MMTHKNLRQLGAELALDPLFWMPADKRGHWVAGAIIALVVGAAAEPLAGLIAAILVATAREGWTWTPSLWREASLDWLMTLLGALSVVALTWL